MEHCIICRQALDETNFSLEHVIPESIGGVYCIYSVCKKCNSEMGQCIDSKVTNHFFTKFERYEQNLVGKTGKLPNPLEGTHYLEGDPMQKVRCDLTSDGFKAYLLPSIKIDEGTMRVSLDITDASKIENIVRKKNEKLEKECKRIIGQTKIVEQENSQPKITGKAFIDLRDFKLAMVKIAYEFTIDIIPEYYNDPNSNIIAEALLKKDFNCSGIKLIGNGLDSSILDCFTNYLEFTKAKHYIILFSAKDIGLMCCVSLFHTFHLGIIMSPRNTYLKQEFMVVGVNDIQNNTFSKVNTWEIAAKISEGKKL